ncbi:GNAT family N-acetyltransferase [Streptosporangium subroseum]|uniref:GNAT family N-acetyltransferase n=1 Tax=Streptosporangium subroseum TaxID=106412 RepID=UPI00343842F3
MNPNHVTPPLPEESGFSLLSVEVGDGQALPVSNTRTISRKRFPRRVKPAVPSLDRTGPASHISSASFMVDPAHAGRGVGRALGEHVLDWARGEGYRAMQFNAVVETNTRAVALWRSLGFEVLATLPEGFAHPAEGYVGLHIMYRPL